MTKLAVAMFLMAQVGLVIMSAEPDRADRLAVRARDQARQVKAATAKGQLNAHGRAKVDASARALLAEAKRIEDDARGGVALSLGEKEQLDRALARTRKLAQWMLAQIAPPKR